MSIFTDKLTFSGCVCLVLTVFGCKKNENTIVLKISIIICKIEKFQDRKLQLLEDNKNGK